MKKITTLALAFLSMFLLETNISKAAFPVKNEAAATQQTTTIATGTTEAATMTVQNPEVLEKTTATHKKAAKASSSVMPAILYVILAILGFGWLAMGINDNFSDFDWLISLILYILFYIPGLIYTLVKMGKYY